ncbi:MAG: ATP-dependent helicase [Patescibacteria group bacterium]
MNEFEKRFNKLNKEQQMAVASTEGAVMVIAGPGTGKTEIIGMRAGYICKNSGILASNILITTFTESGVVAIKKRLLDIMGTDAYKVNVTTLHGFCSQVISDFPEKFIFAKGIKQISDIERIEIIRNIIDSLKLKKLTTFSDKYLYLSDIEKNIQKLKREDVTPENLDDHLESQEKDLNGEYKINKRTGKPTVEWRKKEEQILKNKELSMIYKEYQKKLKVSGLYDYEDMILFVLNKFKEDDELLANYQEQYLYIMVDEYQDTNAAQNEVILLLTSFQSDASPNIFVVGDDDQSIYRFQGASLENILFFKNRYNVKNPIVLKKNYRSTQNILDSSFSMIEKNKNRIGTFIDGVDKKLEAQKGDGEKIDLIKFSTQDTEKFYIFKEIERLIKENVDPNEIAVFSRTNFESHEIAEFLIKENIPVVFEASNNILEGNAVRMLIDYISIIENPYDDQKILNVMTFGFLGINVLDSYKLSRYIYNINYSRKDKLSIFSIISKEESLKDIGLSDEKKITDFIHKLLNLKTLSVEITFTAFCERVFSESGFLDWVYKKNNKMEYLRHISSLFSEIKDLNIQDKSLDIKKFLEKISLYNEYKIPVKEESFLLEKRGVRVMTAHKSKGLEFEYVFITKAVDKNWGNRKNMDKIKLPTNLLQISSKLEFEKNEDERRLFFVALTRAKKKAYITYADEYSSGKSIQEKSISPTHDIRSV